MNRQAMTFLLASALALGQVAIVLADSTEARCDIYPKGEDHTDVVLPCRFYQAQGHVVITRSDGVEYDLTPVPDEPGSFRDQNGQDVYRETGLGTQGLIFRTPQESIFVYWNTALLESSGNRPPYAPASDLDFDATAWTPCRRITDEANGQCPSGVLRMDHGEASVVIEDPPGELLTINFLKSGVDATSGPAQANFKDGVWTVVIDGARIYEVSRSLIEGG
jgi:hypothetical protein